MLPETPRNCCCCKTRTRLFERCGVIPSQGILAGEAGRPRPSVNIPPDPSSRPPRAYRLALGRRLQIQARFGVVEDRARRDGVNGRLSDFLDFVCEGRAAINMSI